MCLRILRDALVSLRRLRATASDRALVRVALTRALSLAVRVDTWLYEWLLGRAQPVIPPNFSIRLMFMNNKAWGPCTYMYLVFDEALVGHEWLETS